MATNFSPVFALRPEVKLAVITATTIDKSGSTSTNIIELLVAPLDGVKVTWIKFKHIGTSTVGRYLIWITDTSGNNPNLFQELAITAVTSSNSATTHEDMVFFPDLQLKQGQKILVGSTSANTNIHVTASIGELG